MFKFFIDAFRWALAQTLVILLSCSHVLVILLFYIIFYLQGGRTWSSKLDQEHKESKLELENDAKELK